MSVPAKGIFSDLNGHPRLNEKGRTDKVTMSIPVREIFQCRLIRPKSLERVHCSEINDGRAIVSGLSTGSLWVNVATVGEFWGVLRRKYDEMGVLAGSSLSLLGNRRGEGLRRGGDDDNLGDDDWTRYQ